jgi:hypothetical protein
MSSEQDKSEKKGGMPTWVKVLLIVIAVCVGGSITLMGLGYFLYTSIVKNDSASAQQTVEKIVSFKEPLSKDFKYVMGVDADMFGTKIGVVSHVPDSTNFVVAQTTGADKTVTTKQIVEHLQKDPRAAFSVTKEATANVGGKQFDYVIGKAGQADATRQIMIGSMTLSQPQAHSVIIVESMEDGGVINQKLTDDFLNNIQSVK